MVRPAPGSVAWQLLFSDGPAAPRRLPDQRTGLRSENQE